MQAFDLKYRKAAEHDSVPFPQYIPLSYCLQALLPQAFPFFNYFGYLISPVVTRFPSIIHLVTNKIIHKKNAYNLKKKKSIRYVHLINQLALLNFT